MINAKELRIGNVVIINGGTDYSKQEEHILDVIDIGVAAMFPERFSPMLLNPQILFRMGANNLNGEEEVKDLYHYSLNNKTVAIYICCDSGSMEANNGKFLLLINGANFYSSECRYAHQLQNLMFSLNGIELPFSLKNSI